MTRVLVVEDERSFVEALQLGLGREGFEVVSALDGKSGLEAYRSHHPDIVLLDLMLPGMAGLDVLRAIRRESAVPVVVVSAKDTEADVVTALELGADDYVKKPYSIRELVARIRAATRRANGLGPAETLTVGTLSLDSVGHRVQVAGRDVDFPKKEFEVLQLLMEQPGRVIDREVFLDQIWGFAWVGDTRTLDQHIRRIRRRLERAQATPTIETVRGVGYRLRT